MIKFKIRKNSEGEVQSRLYIKLESVGLHPYCQYRYNRCIFDIVLLDKQKENILLIVEVKSRKRIKSFIPCTKQYKKYLAFNTPVVYCWNMNDIERCVMEVKAIMS